MSNGNTFHRMLKMMQKITHGSWSQLSRWPNLLSTTEKFGNQTDGLISCRHSTPTSLFSLNCFCGVQKMKKRKDASTHRATNGHVTSQWSTSYMLLTFSLGIYSLFIHSQDWSIWIVCKRRGKITWALHKTHQGFRGQNALQHRMVASVVSDNFKCLRFGHWLTLCTLNMHIQCTYLLTSNQVNSAFYSWWINRVSVFLAGVKKRTRSSSVSAAGNTVWFHMSGEAPFSDMSSREELSLTTIATFSDQRCILYVRASTHIEL